MLKHYKYKFRTSKKKDKKAVLLTIVNIDCERIVNKYNSSSLTFGDMYMYIWITKRGQKEKNRTGKKNSAGTQ